MASVAKAPQTTYISAEKKITTPPKPSLAIPKQVEDNPKKILGEYIEKYGQNDILSALADCESTFRNICIVDTNGKLSCGMFQFQYDTFKENCSGDWHNSLDQIKCADSMIKKGLGKYHWVTCWKTINNTINKLKL